MHKHIFFLSEQADDFSQNEDFVKNKLLKNFNPNVYDHATVETNPSTESNLIILFGEKLLKRKFPNQEFQKFFKDEEGQWYFSFPRIKDIKDNEELKKFTKDTRDKINKFFRRFAVVRVTDRAFYYRDIDFKKVKESNPYRANFKFVEDPNGEFLSYEGKKLKKVSKDFATFNQTYEEHLRSTDLFYYENYPLIGHTNLLHYMTFDIETNHSLDIVETPEPIISIAAYSNIYNRTFVWLLKKRPEQFYDKTKFPKEKLFIFEDEKKMLDHFYNVMNKLEVDLIAGWNSAFYDIPYLLHRSRKLGAEPAVFLPSLYQTIGKDGERAYHSHEVILWDYERYAKWVIIENKPLAWSLDSVAQHLFQEKKTEHESTDKLWNEDDLTRLLEYNIRDVYLTEKINVKQRLIEFPIVYQKIVPQTFENVYFNSRFLENLIHQRFKQFKFPTKARDKEYEKFPGALVLPTKAGIYENVSVYDFASLYPSLMISLNISKETILNDIEFDPKIHIKIGDIIFRTDKVGIVPQISKLLLTERNKLKKKKMEHDGNSQEFKILNDMETCFKATSNALFGVLGYKGCIINSREAASSITYAGRDLLRFIKAKTEDKGYRILSGDTDSIHIEIKADTFEENVKKSKELQDIFNNSIREFLRSFTENEQVLNNNNIKIVFEKSFSKLLLTEAKKKQVGYLKYFKGKFIDGEEDPYIKGFEAIKDDTPTYFKTVLNRLYKMILNHYNDTKKLEEFIALIKKELPQQTIEDLIVRKRMSKRFEDYDNVPNHIRAQNNSHVVLKRGETVNVVYVKDSREVIHYAPELNMKFEMDYAKYFEKFFVNKIDLIDNSLYKRLFVDKNKLADISASNIKKRVEKKITIKKII